MAAGGMGSAARPTGLPASKQALVMARHGSQRERRFVLLNEFVMLLNEPPTLPQDLPPFCHTECP
jgi:hypothetical protein